MPVLTITFNLPEEQAEADLARRASDYSVVLFDIVSEARRRVKYCEPSEDMQEFYDWMWQTLREANIDPFA